MRRNATTRLGGVRDGFFSFECFFAVAANAIVLVVLSFLVVVSKLSFTFAHARCRRGSENLPIRWEIFLLVVY